jgi:class 3 adenylate cyclase
MDRPVVEVRQPGRRPLHVIVDDQLEVGRVGTDLLLADPGVSRRHARLEIDDEGRISVIDLGSTNGTLVNGAKVSGATPVGPGDVVEVGGTTLLVVDTCATVPPAPVEEPDVDLKATVVGAGFWRTGPVGEVALDPRESSIISLVSSVDRDRGPGAAIGGDGDTITIVFSDIESSTEQALRLGDGRWFDLLEIHHSIVRNNLLRHGGTEVKNQGDGFMLTFTSARRAVQFCIDVQQALTRWSDEHPDEAVRIRVGVHTGEALVGAGGDLFGKHIIVAARIANLADGGEILASHVVREITSNRGDLEFGEGRSVSLKGIEGTYEVHPVIWR